MKNEATATLATNARSTVLLEGVNRDEGRWLRLEAGHEYHAVLEDGEPRATVPDIITVFDVHTGEPVPVRELRYGLRVVVLALPCPPLWRGSEALRLVGPRAFGLAVESDATSFIKAAVSSFGFSGTNAHLVIEEYAPPPDPAA